VAPYQFSPVKLLYSTLLLVAPLLLAGCRSAAQSASAAGPVLNVIALDRSGSTENARDLYKGVANKSFLKAQALRQQLAVWAVDRESVCLFGPRRARGDRLPPQVFRELDQNVRRRTSQRTRPAVFWEQMASRYGNTQSLVRIAYFTDGGNDWADEKKRVAAAASRLSGNPNLFITIAGVNPDQRTWLEDAFRPLDKRFLISSKGEELDALRDWLTQGTGG
jgi:hypothetical protein